METFEDHITTVISEIQTYGSYPAPVRATYQFRRTPMHAGIIARTCTPGVWGFRRAQRGKNV